MANLIDYKDVLKYLEINMSKNSEKSDGTSTHVVENKLKDTAADFVDDGIKVNMIVFNQTLLTYSYVIAVDDLNNLSLNDNIFTTTNQQYYIFNYEDITVTAMEYHINFAIEETFNRLRKKFDDPETLLVDETTVKEIAIYFAVYRIGRILYNFFETPLDKLKELRDLALEYIDDIIDGKIVLDLAADSEKTNIITGVLKGGDILRTNDYEDDYTQKEWWESDIDTNL